MKLRSLLGLIACNIIWSIHPVFAKTMMVHFSPLQTAFLRYGSALLGFLLVAPLLSKRWRKPSFFVPRNLRQGIYLLAMGGVAFCFSPALQLLGLSSSNAVDNSVIMALEPLLAVLLAWVFLRERLPAVYYFLFAVALGGYVLLSGMDLGSIRWVGNALMFVSVLAESSYSIFSRKLMDWPSLGEPVAIYGSALTLGVLFLCGVLAYAAPGSVFSFLSDLDWKAILVFFWMGPLGTSLAYVYWMVVLKEAPLSVMAVTLFIQPVLGMAWGMWFLGERFSWVQGLGALLILGAVLVAGVLRWSRPARQVASL